MSKKSLPQKAMILQDVRNGIYPVVVLIPNGAVNERTKVKALYPFGWEEYSGVAYLGRFCEPDAEVKHRLVSEILILRHVIQKLTGTNDRTMGDTVLSQELFSEEWNNGFPDSITNIRLVEKLKL